MLDKARQLTRRIKRSGLLDHRPRLQAVKASSMVGLRHYAYGSGDQLAHRSPQHWLALTASADRCFERGEFAESIAYLRAASEERRSAAESTGLDSWGLRICGSAIVDSIGHTAVGLGVRARFRELGWDRTNYLVLTSPWAANPRFLAHFRSLLPIAEVGRGGPVYTEAALWPIVEDISSLGSGPTFRHLYQAMSEAEVAWEAESKPPLLVLENEDEDIGREFLHQAGMPSDAWFVTLHVRQDTLSADVGRNTGIIDYLPAIETVLAAGGWVVRLGTPGMTPLPSRERVIDLAAVAGRSPSVDLYLLAACRFMIGTSSGPVNVPPLFGRPVLQTNTTGFGALPYVARALCLPKLVAEGRGRTVSISEMIERGLSTKDGRRLDGVTGSADGLRWRDNTPAEIAVGVQEMLDDAWTRGPSDVDGRMRELQQTVVEFAGPRMSPAFLELHLG